MSRRFLILITNLLLCALLSSATTLFSVGPRAILRSIGEKENSVEADRAVELNASNFDAVLRDTPATYAIVEFFAHWCPACRNYKPHYEKVARLFNGPDGVHPGIILMSRVDCALKINNKLCDKFSVNRYPMLLWGGPSKFVAASWKPKQEKGEIREIDDFLTADRLLNWINKATNRSFGLDDEKFENEQLPSNISDIGQIARAVYDVEESTTTAFNIILEHKMIKSETRASLIRFLQLIVVHHPSKWCRKGSAEVLVNFDNLSPSHMQSADKKEIANTNQTGNLGSIPICGKEVPRGYWIYCRGSRNDTRGFSCGLWVLLHSLSVRIDDGESQFTFTAICDFIHNFFICEECRRHFYELCSSVTSPFNKTRDFSLWLWSTHNKVNERLMKVEASLKTGDPKFPKIIWPPEQLCSSCRRSHGVGETKFSQIDWDQEEVFKFLTNYYGKTLVSMSEDKNLLRNDGTDEDMVVSTNAVVVPVGAALAIALASVAFGALACYWRSQQKTRKPRRSWN